MKDQTEELKRLLDLDVDGMTTSEEGLRLEREGGGPEFVIEKKALEKVHLVLDSARIKVQKGFKDQLMQSLPIAAWEARGRRAWMFPAAVMTLLFAFIAGLTRFSTEEALGGALVGVAASMGQMVVATVATGGGLLDASWRALGWGVREVVTTSPLIGVVFGIALLSLSLLLYSLLRSRTRKSWSRSSSRRRR